MGGRDSTESASHVKSSNKGGLSEIDQDHYTNGAGLRDHHDIPVNLLT